jgi:class 3 adenylate cyclase/tetratricopeptide (TPR) repeat protein
MCGAPLQATTKLGREERKVVTVLFCDLVGFTQRAEELDPEDVRAILAPYHGRLRSELERHGGTVEKFIGDAVMALFGAPVAHEDDPERAVRAALAVRDFALEERLELRVGVTTGEALISLGASPAEGEGMASGDVVNTAARLQSAAPVNGILADETTYRATRHAIDYRQIAAVEAKGKAKPIPVWEPLTARSRFGIDVTHHARSALVGRERELAVLREAFERTRYERAPQLVTLVAVPGMGKSRLVFELSQIVDADPEIVTWRQGRCLAYGDGVTLWALTEVVKAQAGIDERDAEAEASNKLHAAVEDVLDGTGDVDWVESHLRPLVGLESDIGFGVDHRSESFAAWRRFLEGLAEQRPLVLVLEDLHWADDGLLDFIDELVEWLTGVPLLVVCSARPELLERRPGWGGGKLNATTLGLSPLTSEQTALLISRVLEQSLLPVETQQALLTRAEGNPLYAEQFAQLYIERGSVDDLEPPETLQGIVAARLDALAPEEKALLQDASVLGKVFWTGALRRREHEVAPLLHSLERKAFLIRQRRSSVEGEGEWAFSHMLLRDVAYGQIPRSARASKHLETATWFESLGRSDDHAESRAFHWRSALELARAAGRSTSDLERPARVAFCAAGERAVALGAFRSAADYFAAALEMHDDAADRPRLFFQRADALFRTGAEEREEALERARSELYAAGDEQRAAEAEILLARVLWEQGRRDASDACAERAEKMARHGEPSDSKARVLSLSARLRVLGGDEEVGHAIAEDALAMATALSLDEVRSQAMGTIGLSKDRLGDPSALRDLETSLEIARAANSPVASQAANNLAVISWNHGEVVRWRKLVPESRRLAERAGDVQAMRWAQSNIVIEAFLSGDWDDACAGADEFIASCESGEPHYMESAMRNTRSEIRLARGDSAGALEDTTRALSLGRKARDPQNLVPALKVASRVHTWLERYDEGRRFALELLSIAPLHASENLYYHHPLWPVEKLEITTQVHELFTNAAPSPWRDAQLALLERHFALAVQIYADVGYDAMVAELHMVAGEEFISEGLLTEGETELAQALGFYRRVNAKHYIDRCERFLLTNRPAISDA